MAVDRRRAWCARRVSVELPQPIARAARSPQQPAHARTGSKSTKEPATHHDHCRHQEEKHALNGAWVTFEQPCPAHRARTRSNYVRAELCAESLLAHTAGRALLERQRTAFPRVDEFRHAAVMDHSRAASANSPEEVAAALCRLIILQADVARQRDFNVFDRHGKCFILRVANRTRLR